jgi:O-antigen ligase
MVKLTTNFIGLDLLIRSIPFFMGIFIFFNPFPHTTAIKEICYYLSLVIVIILILSKKIDFTFKTPLLLPFGLFILWSFLSIFFAFDKENSIHDFFSHLIRYVVLYYILINFFNSEKRLVYLSWVIIISSSIFIIGGLIYYYFILEENSLKFGIFTQASVNIIGAIAVFAIFLALNHLRNENHLYLRVFLAFSLLVLFIGLLLTRSDSSLLAIFLAGIFFFSKNKKWMFVFLILILMIGTISPFKKRFQLNNPRKMFLFVRKDIRIKMNYLTLEVIKEYPIIGIGFGLQTYSKIDLGKYQKRLPQKYHQTNIVTDPHNIVLDVAVRLGLPGLAFFLYIVFVFLKMCWNIIRHGKDNFMKNWGRCLAACFIAVSTIGLFHPVFSHIAETIFCAMFSMLTIVWRFNDEPISKDVA